MAVQGVLSSVDDRTIKESNLNFGGPFIASTHVISLNLLSAKSTHRAKARIKGKRKSIPPAMEGTTKL